MLAGSAQFLHFALFPADERSNFLRRVQLLPGMNRYAVVEPDVALDSLVEVFVIKSFDIVE